MTKKQKGMLTRILLSLGIYIVLAVLEHTGAFSGLEAWALFGLYAIPYGIVGWDIVFKAFRGIRNRQVFDENFLMTIATFGAAAIGQYE